VATAAYAMFLLGTLLNYLLIFPLTVRFLGTYQVSEAVDNMLTIQSYVDTLISMSLVMGIVFELPVVSAILGRMGIINRSIMREYRRHAIVGILVVSAIITPTTDVITLFIVAMPIWLLYEISILLIRSH
jgi:sec-independent protein translocase protein TatC